MPLAVDGLTIAIAEILKLTDATNIAFRGWPTSNNDVATNWARVARAFFETQSFPAGINIASIQDPAEQAFITAMEAKLETTEADKGATGVDAGFAAYASTIASEAILQNPTVTICTPPPASLDIASKVTGVTADPATPAATTAAAIVAWASTGTATQDTTSGPWL